MSRHAGPAPGGRTRPATAPWPAPGAGTGHAAAPGQSASPAAGSFRPKTWETAWLYLTSAATFAAGHTASQTARVRSVGSGYEPAFQVKMIWPPAAMA